MEPQLLKYTESPFMPWARDQDSLSGRKFPILLAASDCPEHLITLLPELGRHCPHNSSDIVSPLAPEARVQPNSTLTVRPWSFRQRETCRNPSIMVRHPVRFITLDASPNYHSWWIRARLKKVEMDLTKPNPLSIFAIYQQEHHVFFQTANSHIEQAQAHAPAKI